MLSAIVHDYFLNRGVPGSADMIPSASEPVLFSTFIIINYRKKSTGNLCIKEYLCMKNICAWILIIGFELVLVNNFFNSKITNLSPNKRPFYAFG